jgi:PAS domain S-box-containing protein
MADVLSTGRGVRNAEVQIERPDGSRVSALVSIDPLFDSEGSVVGAVNCFQDVTELRSANDALRLSQRDWEERVQRLAITYEHTNVAIAEVDAAGRRLRVNETACRITGLTREELVGKDVFENDSPADAELDRKQFNRLVAGEINQYSVEKRFARKDGTIIWIAATCSAVRDNNNKFLYAVRVFDDVTESKQLADALTESEQRLAATYEQATIGISEVDEDGRFLRVNEASCAITGLSRDELLGSASLFDRMDPKVAKAEREQYRRQVAGEIDRYTIEKRIRRKDGTEVWVSVMSSSVRDRDGRFRYAVRVLQDISERKMAESRQKTMIDELNHRVKNTLATVQSMARQTSRGTSGVKEFEKRFEGRLIALSQAHDQLTLGSWQRADLRGILDSALSAYGEEMAEQVVIHGEPITLSPRAALTLAMVFHELITNAVKYGSLSQPAGRLFIGWRKQTGEDGGTLLQLRWQESNGPAVQPSARRGFGSRMIERSIPTELGGSTALRFEPTGVICDIAFTLVSLGEQQSEQPKRRPRIRRRG